MTTVPQFRKGGFTPSIPPHPVLLSQGFSRSLFTGGLAPAIGVDLGQPCCAPIPSPLGPAQLLGKVLQGSEKLLPGSLSSEQHGVVPPSHKTSGRY